VCICMSVCTISFRCIEYVFLKQEKLQNNNRQLNEISLLLEQTCVKSCLSKTQKSRKSYGKVK